MIIKLAIQSLAQPHQQAAVEKLSKSPGIIVYHGLGSGKTLTSILAGEKHPGKKLVVPPASLASNYSKELEKFHIDKKDYGLVSLETFRKNPEKYIEYPPSLMIVDEFHRSRTEDTASHEAIKKVRPKVKKFIGLTGSILSNDPSEIVPLVNIAAGGPVFKDVKSFEHDFLKREKIEPGFFAKTFFKAKPGEVVKAKNLDAFKEMVSPYIHSFTGDKEYFKHIPTVSKEVVKIPMSEEQQEFYDFTTKRMPKWMRYKIQHNIPPSKAESAKINAFMSTSRQLSNSLAPFGNTEETPKIKQMIHDIKHGIKKDKNFKSIAFSNYMEAGLNPLSDAMKKNNIQHATFSGNETQEDRARMIKDYNDGKLKHLLISPAGVEGLDLKGTKLVQKMEPDWNIEKSNQAFGRAARFKSHEMLPENERKVLIKEYLSEPRLSRWGKIKRFFNPASHDLGIDEYVRNRAIEKGQLNEEFLNVIKGIQ